MFIKQKLKFIGDENYFQMLNIIYLIVFVHNFQHMPIFSTLHIFLFGNTTYNVHYTSTYKTRYYFDFTSLSNILYHSMKSVLFRQNYF